MARIVQRVDMLLERADVCSFYVYITKSLSRAIQEAIQEAASSLHRSKYWHFCIMICHIVVNSRLLTASQSLRVLPRDLNAVTQLSATILKDFGKAGRLCFSWLYAVFSNADVTYQNHSSRRYCILVWYLPTHLGYLQP